MLLVVKHCSSDYGRPRCTLICTCILLTLPCRLNSCDLTEKSYDIVASALQSSSKLLRDLDLSYNNLGDSGVKLLCAGLISANCKLQRLG